MKANIKYLIDRFKKQTKEILVILTLGTFLFFGGCGTGYSGDYGYYKYEDPMRYMPPEKIHVPDVQIPELMPDVYGF